MNSRMCVTLYPVRGDEWRGGRRTAGSLDGLPASSTGSGVTRGESALRLCDELAQPHAIGRGMAVG